MNALLQPQSSRRAMTLRDLDAVLAVEVRAYSWPWSRGNFIDALAAGYTAELLVDSDGSLLGYFVAMTGADELHLLNVTVAPEWQCRGYGSSLLDVVEAQGREHGLASLWLEVRQSNHRARALYARRGFAEVGVRRGYYPAAGGREDAVVMRLAMAGEGPHAVV